jgi:hypothetical protein
VKEDEQFQVERILNLLIEGNFVSKISRMVERENRGRVTNIAAHRLLGSRRKVRLMNLYNRKDENANLWIN